MKISVVILNWNGQQLLEKFLPSVIENSKQANIFVADNSSSDGSIAFIQKHYPEIKIIKNSKNFGYANGYNEALKSVDADVYILLNSDVEVAKNWLQPIIQTFENEPHTAIVQPKILDYKQKDTFEYAGAAGGFIDKFGFPYCRGRIFMNIEKDHQQYNQKSNIFWASGACFCIRKSVFDDLNGFDQDFFAHQEEIDLCWRAFNKGFDVKYEPKSTVYHQGGATLEASNPIKTYLNFRNSLLMLTKNLPKSKLFLILFLRMVLDGLAGIRFLLKGEFKHLYAVVKAHFSFYKMFGKTLSKRGTNQKPNYFGTKSIVFDYYLRNGKVFAR